MYVKERNLINNGDRMLIKRVDDPKEVVGYYSIINKYIDPYWMRDTHGGEFSSEYGHIVGMLNFLEQTYGDKTEDYIPHISMDDLKRYQDYYCKHGADPRKGDCEVGADSCDRNWRSMARLYAFLKSENPGDKEQLFKAAMAEASYAKGKDVGGRIEIYRESPDFFVKSVLKHAKIHDLNVYMEAEIQKTSGARPGEGVNVRSDVSLYGKGIYVEYDDDLDPLYMTIDLSEKAQTRPLRSDGVLVGRIKKPRKITIYGSKAMRELDGAIRFYLNNTQDRIRENTGPLVVNKRQKMIDGMLYNMAYTYESYNTAFHRLVEKYVIPELKAEGGEKKVFAEILEEYGYGPHMLREYFTCQMVLEGRQWYEIMAARGDKCPTSAIVYLMKGGVCKRITISNANKTGHEIMEEAEINYDEWLQTFKTGFPVVGKTH